MVKQVKANADDTVTILDISLDRNRDALVEVLGSGAFVTYIDHHFAGDIPTGNTETPSQFKL